MADDLTTKSTLDTLLEIMQGVRDEVRAGFEAVDERLERLETRMDRVESIALETRAPICATSKSSSGNARSGGSEETRRQETEIS